MDVRARTIAVSSSIDAPADKGARGTITWLTRQLTAAPVDLIIEAYPKNARTGTISTLGAALEDPTTLVDDQKRAPAKFVIIRRTEMGAGRKASRKPGFIDSVLSAMNDFYAMVLQDVAIYQARAPRLTQQRKTTDQPDSSSTETSDDVESLDDDSEGNIRAEQSADNGGALPIVGEHVSTASLGPAADGASRVAGPA